MVVLDATNEREAEKLTKIVYSSCILQEQEPNSLHVARTFAHQPFVEKPVVAACRTRGIVQVDAFALIKQNYPYKDARGIIDLSPIRFLYATIVNTTKNNIRLAKNQLVALMYPPVTRSPTLKEKIVSRTYFRASTTKSST